MSITEVFHWAGFGYCFAALAGGLLTGLAAIWSTFDRDILAKLGQTEALLFAVGLGTLLTTWLLGP